jgi:trans-AT polyketide synthase, acyltransferase and oxidoreductase domains
MRAWLFPGQGSQHKGMGADLFAAYPEHCAQADEILGYPLHELCADDPDGRLRRTEFAQPAMFVVNALAALATRSAAPAYLAGHSLGELNALHAAGCFDFTAGVRLVQRRGQLMARAAGGGMLAVLGLDLDALTRLLDGLGVTELDVANHNTAEQVVLSGPQDALSRVAARIRETGQGRCVPLNVSAAFHSRYMQEAAAQFGRFLDGVPLQPPRVPVIANVTGAPYPATGLAELLVQQISSPVRWRDSMRYLAGQGVDDVVEVGPGRVLTGLWQTIAREPRPVPVPAPVRPPHAAAAGSGAESLGSAEFRRDYGIRYAYLAGSMFRGIASVDLVVRMARAGLMGFFGTGGLTLKEVEDALVAIGRQAGSGRYGMNLLHAPDEPELERRTVELFLRHDVRYVEAAAFTAVTAPLVLFRYRGGVPRHIVAKVSRPEVATAFMQPPPEAVLRQLVAEDALTESEAQAARRLPVSADVCVEADSAGHTDGGVALVLLPRMTRLRDELMDRFGYPDRIRVGASGGLGSPEAVAAAFLLGADFVVTGSVNQCSPQAGTSDAVKDLLAGLDVQDTTYAPAGDLFELGARVQVVRRGTLFAARANKLYQLYRQFGGLDEIDARTRDTIEETYFRRSFDQVWQETREYYLASGRTADAERVAAAPKLKMAAVFKWYFAHTIGLALAGRVADQVNFQVHCGPAMGAFNRFVAGTPLQDWRARDVDTIAGTLMSGAAQYWADRSGC